MKFLASKIRLNSFSSVTLLYWSLLNLLVVSSVSAETQSQTLGAQIGATDLYQLTCGAETSYASLKLLDTTSEAQSSVAPQLINAELSKEELVPQRSTIIEGTSNQFILSGGNGKYQLKIDSTDSNPSYPTQKYQIFFQCYNENNVATAGSGSGLKAGKFVNKTIATYKSKRQQIPASKIYNINCKTNRKAVPNDSSYLKVMINNTTVHFDPTEIYLNAQLTRTDFGSTINASDSPGDQEYGSIVQLPAANISNNSSYYISIDSTASNQQTTLKEKSYSFEYGCFSANHSPTSANISTPIQDQ